LPIVYSTVCVPCFSVTHPQSHQKSQQPWRCT
jgi:hypothetical protein